MASESTEAQTVSIELSSELADWLDEQARELDIEREEVLLQLVASYRKTAKFDAETAETAVIPETVVAETVERQLEGTLDREVDSRIESALDEELNRRIEGTVQSILADTLDEQLESAVRENADTMVTDRVNEARNAVQRQLGGRMDSVESGFQEKIEDVRERVIQVKKETDKKAPKDHSHAEFASLAELEDEMAAVAEELDSLRTAFEETAPEHGEMIDDLDGRFDEIQDRLQTVAWVVSDLREAHESGNGLEAVERIKRAAAKADIDRAKCENCGEGVTLSLLTDPECPHCNATVTNVEADSGWFRKPKLRVAAKLESGEST